MIDAREIALSEERNKIVFNSRRFKWITIPYYRKYFKIGIEVFHDDGELDQIQESLQELLIATRSIRLNSCEMISDHLYNEIASRYPKRNIVITVSLDGKTGSEIYYNL